jgi:A/G-specific adenine glycosylase
MNVDASQARIKAITAIIGAYYVDKARELPWRAPPGADLPDPYHVWLSEIMLQQTTVAAVKPYFARFVARWPTVAALAEASEAEVLAAWAGLGYYSRARNLHRCAREVVEAHGGAFPADEAALRRLPGIGDYTAAAIAAIAFGQRAIVVDANIERLMARLFAIATPLPQGKAAIRAAMASVTPDGCAGDFAQACMDIGATLCTARRPSCAYCPLSEHCAALASGKAEDFPIRPPKKAKPLQRGRMFWIEADGALLLARRPDKGMLARMVCLPDDNWSARADGDRQPPIKGDWHIRPGIVQHSFTHFTLVVDLAVYRGGKIATNSIIGQDRMHWCPLDQLDSAGLPSLYHKAVQWQLRQRATDTVRNGAKRQAKTLVKRQD